MNFIAGLPNVFHATKLPEGYFERVVFLFQDNWQSYLIGAGKTLLIALVGTIIGCIIGFIIGIIQTIPETKKDPLAKKIIVKFVKVILGIYVEVFRGTPMLVQGAFIYYGLSFAGIHMPILFAAFLIVSINTGAYMAETVRGGILSIDEGQTEGAKAIGMTHYQAMINVILPQAFRNILPQIGNNLIINIKDTCVLAIIGVSELFLASKSVAGAYYVFFESYTITMIIYLIMTLACSRLLRILERKMAGPKEYNLATTDTLAHTSGMTNYPSGRGRGRIG